MKTAYGPKRPAPAPEPGEYARPDSLVSTAWLAERLRGEDFVLVECDGDPGLYGAGHIPGARHLDWRRDLNDQTTRDMISPEEFAALAGRLGITPDTAVIFYGDSSNWWAAYALWVFHLFGHRKTGLLNGGRDKWIAEGRPLVRDVPAAGAAEYPVPARGDAESRAFFGETLDHTAAGLPLVDARGPGEFSGEITFLPEFPGESALRAGHIPGALSVPWSLAFAGNGLFKSAENLHEIFHRAQLLAPSDDIVVYCRIGERAALTWFVLTRLLGYERVRVYDGSWMEWGNRVGAPVSLRAAAEKM